MNHVEVTIGKQVGAGAIGEYVNELLHRGVETILIKATPEYVDELTRRREKEASSERAGLHEEG